MKRITFLLLPLLLTFGCATWDGFSPGTQSALKIAAKLAISLGVSQLGESVKELKPYQERLNGLIETTFSKALPPESIGVALKAGVEQHIPAELRAAVLKEFKAALVNPNTPAAGPSADYNQRLADRL